jgi:hypothetical protein
VDPVHPQVTKSCTQPLWNTELSTDGQTCCPSNCSQAGRAVPPSPMQISHSCCSHWMASMNSSNLRLLMSSGGGMARGGVRTSARRVSATLAARRATHTELRGWSPQGTDAQLGMVGPPRSARSNAQLGSSSASCLQLGLTHQSPRRNARPQVGHTRGHNMVIHSITLTCIRIAMPTASCRSAHPPGPS